MAEVMTYTLERTRKLSIANIAVGERMHTPTPKQIDEMASSLQAVGQLSPIMVHHVTHNSWRIVTGNTRLLAAFKLKWTHLRADIICGHALDYRIIELTENAERRSLTAGQRAAAKAELKKLIHEKLASITAAKGGRGNKGGISEEARQLGVPKTTALRMREAKPVQNIESGPVSALQVNGQDTSPAVTLLPPIDPIRRYPISVRFTEDERGCLERYNAIHGSGPLSDCMRKIIMKEVGGY